MKTPPFLLAASMMFWGWHTGLWIFAMIMAVVVESSRFTRLRWELSLSDFTRISDLCTILFIGIFAYLLLSNRSVRVIFILIQWLPLAFFPLLLFQEYSDKGRIDIRALSLIFRKQGRTGNKSPITINITYPFFILCILSASAANVRNLWFYLGMLFFAGWGLWPVRSRRNSPLLWGCVLLVAGITGYAGQIGLHRLQLIIEQKGMEWFVREDADPYQSVTAIGDIGTLKLSDRILFRVTPDAGERRPLLLREASYNTYKFSRWFAVHADFTAMHPEADGTTWHISPDPGKSRSLNIASYLRKGKGVLKLPNGTFQVENLPVSMMELNPLGAVKVEDGPGLIRYGVRFSEQASCDSPPNESDFIIPLRERAAINKIAEELGLSSVPPREISRRISAFFTKKFRYSVILRRDSYHGTPLTDFLRETRSGHCEYFATATVLLLRAAGIPARYAVGYLVHEFSSLENRFVVRDRDAHAWTLVYLEGAWRNLDTTPSSWVATEEEAASPLEFITDIWSWLVFGFSEWRLEREGGIAKYMAWLLIPLILILARRLYAKKRVKRAESGQAREDEVKYDSGTDSEFYLIEKRLNELGFVRYPWETLADWLKRTEASLPPTISVKPLYSALELHYRYRFDPHGITPDERAALTLRSAKFILHDMAANKSSRSCS